MSCFPIGRHTRRRKVPNIPDQRDEQQDRDESTEYRELRERAQVEHSLVFIPILQRLIARVRNRDRQCDIDEINEGDLRLLKDATYFGYIRSLYPDVEFTIDTVKGNVHLRGRGKSFEDAFDKCFKQLFHMEIVKQSLRLSTDERWKWNIVANMHCQTYLEENLASNGIIAKVCHKIPYK